VILVIRAFLKRLLIKHKALFFQEAQRISGFLYLLMKQRNTDEKWTPEEKKEIKRNLKILAMYIPILIIFFLPGGSLLLPLLAEIMDRRKTRRRPPDSVQPPVSHPEKESSPPKLKSETGETLGNGG
jgi:hypothetical protein